MKKLSFMLLLSVGFTMVACEKAENKKSEVSFRKEIANFETSDDLFNEIKKLREMSLEDLKKYEESKGYLSFGRHCDELYASIDFENIKTEDEYYDLANKNSDYLEIIEKDGEKYFEAKLATNPYRYVINKDNLFQCGVRIYKVFEDGVVSTHVSNKSKLMNFNPKSLINEASDAIFQISYFENSEISKDTQNNCGASLSASQTNGSDRTNMGTSLSLFHGESPSYAFGRFTQLMSDTYIRPYKKTLGIWFYCSRTISCDIKLAVDYLPSTNVWARVTTSYSNSGTHQSVLWHTIAELVCTGGYCSPPRHYGGTKSWGDTPSTNHVYLNCNQHLF
ncbi:MAG: hypothetical protein KA734_02170 [Fluviicola sp.]|nr:hypothetical protein [Fluviicola sp.]